MLRPDDAERVHLASAASTIAASLKARSSLTSAGATSSFGSLSRSSRSMVARPRAERTAGRRSPASTLEDLLGHNLAAWFGQWPCIPNYRSTHFGHYKAVPIKNPDTFRLDSEHGGT